MKLINELGENLNFLINCQYVYCHDWLSFVSWYSINKYIPDAKVTVACQRTSMSEQFFRWTKKVNVDFRLNKEVVLENCLMIDPWVFAARELKDIDVNSLNSQPSDQWLDSLCAQVKSEDFKPLMNCQQGVGNFVMSEWIHTLKCPLSMMDRYMSLDANYNEVRILSLMQQLSSLYSDISRG